MLRVLRRSFVRHVPTKVSAEVRYAFLPFHLSCSLALQVVSHGSMPTVVSVITSGSIEYNIPRYQCVHLFSSQKFARYMIHRRLEETCQLLV
jgi:hypothetical protein